MIGRYRTLVGGGWRWLASAVALFAAGLLLGYAAAAGDPDRVLAGMAPVLAMVRGVAERVNQAGDPLSRAWPILANNVRAATVMLLGGIIFGFFPAFAMLINGLFVGVVGAVGGRLAPQAANPLVFLASLAPHGVFELPAFFLAAAWGMKLGLAWLLPSSFGCRRQTLARTAGEGVLILPLSLGLLVIAALVEANLTPAVVHAVIASQLSSLGTP